MGYDTLIRNLVKTVVSPQFETMKMDVTFKAWIGQSGSGVPDYAAPRQLRALVDFTGRGTQRYTKAGAIIVPMAKLIFLDLPIADTTPNVDQERGNPFDMRDVLTLPNGDTAPIVDMTGFGDPATNAPYAPEVTLGTIVRGQ